MALNFPNKKHSMYIYVSCAINTMVLYLHLYGSAIPVVEESEIITCSITFDKKLCFIPHTKYLKAKCFKALNLLNVLSHTSWDADRTTLFKLYWSSQVKIRLWLYNIFLCKTVITTNA